MEPKTCVIAGANSEIAIAIAKKFISEYRLVLCWHQGHSRVDELLGLDAVSSRQVDLRREEQVDNLMKELFQSYQSIDLLINCVGKNSFIPDVEIAEDVWDDVISTNLKPAYFLCKYYWKYCDRQSPGCIIHLSSTAGLRPFPSSPHYITAKAGLIALSGYYAKLMAPCIRVNTIAPGFVQTERHATPDYDPIRAQIPLRRMAAPSEIAETAAYIANCQYLTAQTIVIDGGLIG